MQTFPVIYPKAVTLQKIILLCVYCLTLTSCITNRKLVYFPDPDFNTATPTDIVNNRQVYRLQPRDVLSVKILTLDLESSEYFNLQSSNQFNQFNEAGLFLNGYSIDPQGYITLPEVGRVLVLNKTLDEAQQLVQEGIRKYLPNATAFVKLVSFKITFVGEVSKPGQYYFFNEQVTLLEALGQAGDLTDFANRENITLLRQTTAGSQAILLNLKDPDLLKSKYYYLQPNDVIYVQPLSARNIRSNLGALSVLSILFGAISTSILLVNFIDRQ